MLQIQSFIVISLHFPGSTLVFLMSDLCICVLHAVVSVVSVHDMTVAQKFFTYND